MVFVGFFRREEEAIKLDGLSVSEVKELREKAEKHTFQAEVDRMMKLIINSLYKNKEVRALTLCYLLTQIDFTCCIYIKKKKGGGGKKKEKKSSPHPNRIPFLSAFRYALNFEITCQILLTVLNYY